MDYKVYGKNPIKQNISIKSKGRKANDDEDYDEDERFVSRSGLYARKLSVFDYDWYLDNTIQAPSVYRDVIQTIVHLGKDDEMRIHLDTGGGRLDSTMRLIQAINNTDGNVVIIGAGLAASAGAILFLRCPSVIVTPEMTMMLHAASYGAVGKESEVSEMVHFSEKTLTKLTTETYQGFLTPLEMEHLKIGKDFFFESDEIIKRLENREKFQEDLLAKKEAEVGKEEAMAKKKVKSKTKPVPKSK